MNVAEMEITFTIFPNVAASSKKEIRKSWGELGSDIQDAHQYASKAACPLIKLGQFGDQRTTENCLRHNANVRAVNGIEGDYDGEIVTMAQAVEKLTWAGIEAVFYTSPSHTDQAPRWRVLCPFACERPPQERRRFLARLNGVLGGILASESFVLSQAYYFGRVNGSPYATQRVEGRCIDELDELDSIAIDNAPKEGKTRGEKTQEASDSDPVIARLRERGMVKRERSDGGVDIICPFDDSHTTAGGDSATVYFAAHTGGFVKGHFDCKHSHCAHRTDAEFLTAIGIGPSEAPQGQSETAAKTEWPVLEDAALYGLPGDIVRAIEPHTEADSAALLVQTLVAFGSYIGRGCHVAIEGDKHHANLYCVLIGKTARGRKGTSWSRVRELFSELTGWTPPVAGVSSGEGIKYHVRDAVESKDGKGGDPGVQDKRLLVIESEFAQVLRTSSRNGNTVSAVIREAWDTGTLRTLTKNDPITATSAHVSIIGHITKDELRSELAETDKANGFANRFLYVCVDRSKKLAHGGGEISPTTIAELRRRLMEAKRLAHNHATTKHAGVIGMTERAKKIWEEVYAELSEGFDGLLGSVTARAEAQVRRIAMIYALMDGLQEVDSVHLLAALALWRYCEQSARYVFGSALGNRVADEILRALRAAGPSGMTRTEIRDLFKRNESADRIGAALTMLSDRKLATSESRETSGRPTEVWRAC
jgi:Protein of unknown function (DUF3987)